MQTIKERIKKLRCLMQRDKVDACVLPTADPHAGEYIPEYWKIREWMSGFTGSAGTLVVTLKQAALWTDSRYFLQADEQLKDTGISLMKDRLPETPSIPTWLTSVLSAHSTVGIDGRVFSITNAETLARTLQASSIYLKTDYAPVDELWQNRPSLPSTPIQIHSLKYAGQSCHDKLSIIREHITQCGAEGILISSLDEIAWALNLRGNDVHCNPVFVSYLLVTLSSATLFIQKEKLTEDICHYLNDEGISTEQYDNLDKALQKYTYPTILVDDNQATISILNYIHQDVHILRGSSPISLLKAVKNEAEIEGFRQAMLRDGVAMVKFLKWLEESVPQGHETEISIEHKLYEFRAEQPLFQGCSFDTIAGYKEHGAIVHYEATPETDKPLAAEGLLLLDSGAQYLDGTTDITRTIALGETSEEEQKDYTLVLKGHIELTRACFPQGTCGTQLDILARQAMWREGINFLHGTGHGVGAYLNVHEGPHQIRMNHVPTALCPGMTVTDEPGIYRAGSHGIRTENILLVIPYKETEYGEFYTFEPLTLCPIDTKPIIHTMLTEEEKQWLNTYHRTVYEKLSPLLDESHRQWLAEKTKTI